LLSYDGKIGGVDFKRSQEYAKRFYEWIQNARPDLSFLFGFGYSMEHPNLFEAIDFCQSLGSPTGEFLQMDGMKFRSEQELSELLSNLKSHGIKLVNLTFYGTEWYHDRFAARNGDYRLMMNTIKAANSVELDVTVGIPLTHENAGQIDSLLQELDKFKVEKIYCFVPHSEGRGKFMEAIRLTLDDYELLSQRVKMLFNRERFKTERQWVQTKTFPQSEHRVLTVTLTPENISLFEKQTFDETIDYLERLDDEYYETIPSFETLINQYGNLNGDRLYSARDLYMTYQRRYIEDHHISIYDINDERQCFVRRI
jgi:hypothetical protein